MIERGSVKAKQMPRLVGVITSLAQLRAATRLRTPPDLFELRLDCLVNVVSPVDKAISSLSAPIIITARDFREGGAKQLSSKERRELLLRFLPHAEFVDIELRSLHSLKSLFDAARKQKVQRILSVHDLASTPDVQTMLAKARQAKSAGAEIFKIATRIDTADQLEQLLEFMKRRPAGIKISAMGIGRLGTASRVALSRLGSVMTYAHMGRSTADGQPSLTELRRLLAR